MMKATLYSTYGLAMRHYPEVLAASGGLTPAVGRYPGERRVRIGLAQMWRWLGASIAKTSSSRMDADSRATSAEGEYQVTVRFR